MADYRLYFLDATGHIRKAVELECADENEAINLAEDHRQARHHDHAMELWQRARLIRHFPPAGEAAKG